MIKQPSIYGIQKIKLDKYNISLQEAIFHNANGYIGIRYDFEEGYPEKYELVPSQYINGFYDFTSMKQPENLYGLVSEKQTMLNIADTQSIKLYINDEQFSMFNGKVLNSELWVDMDKGITVRYVLWRSPEGKKLELRITRMASFYLKSLVTIEYEILPLNFSAEIRLESSHNGDVRNYFDINDPRMAGEVIPRLKPVSCEIKDKTSFVTSATLKSGLEVCSCVRNILSQDHSEEFIVDGHQVICKFKTLATQGKKIKLIKYAVFSDMIRCEDSKKHAAREMEKALSVTLSDLYNKQKEYLADFWANCYVEIEGNDKINIAIKYSLYQLIQSVGKDSYSNIAPKGLSGDGYEGQFFWDSEMYIQPFFTITNPAVSKTLIEYRYMTLDMARENAGILGHRKGALYPWRTIMGKECSGYFPAGGAQYHINGDIAYAIIAYYLATKDLDFIQEKGAEIIFETARLWLETGNFYQGKFYINDVTGPDEYTCIVNNNYYTNVVAQYHLNWAVKIHNLLQTSGKLSKLKRKIRLTNEEIADFQIAAENMYLPYDKKLKINPQDDSFLQKRAWDIQSIPRNKYPLLMHYHPLHLYRHQVCKQADTVMAHFIVEDAQSEETMLNSYNYYEKITTHDSSLSYSIFSVMAARLGMFDKAYHYFECTAELDLLNTHKNTEDGIHTANMGGNYMAIVYGFSGFRLKEHGISFRPFLPKAWSGYRFIIRFEDSRIIVHVRDKECTFKLESGNAKKIFVYEKEYLLEDSLHIKISADDQKTLPASAEQ